MLDDAFSDRHDEAGDGIWDIEEEEVVQEAESGERHSAWETLRNSFRGPAEDRSSATGLVKHWKRQTGLYDDDNVPTEEVRKERTTFRRGARERRASTVSATDEGHWQYHAGVGWGMTYKVRLVRELGQPLGMSVGFQEKMVFVTSVGPDTPAAAVLKTSDRIVSVNDEAATHLNIGALLPKETKSFSIIMVRDDADAIQQDKVMMALTKVQATQRGKLARVEAQRRRWVILRAVIKLQAIHRGERTREPGGIRIQKPHSIPT